MPRGESFFAKYPDYRVDLVPGSEPVQVSFAGAVIAETSRPLYVRETKHDEVVYFAREDVNFAHLVSTDHSTHCPFKGDATYWTLRVGDEESENSVWGYEDPFPEVAGLAGYVAFYPDRVEWSR